MHAQLDEAICTLAAATLAGVKAGEPAAIEALEHEAIAQWPCPALRLIGHELLAATAFEGIDVGEDHLHEVAKAQGLSPHLTQERIDLVETLADPNERARLVARAARILEASERVERPAGEPEPQATDGPEDQGFALPIVRNFTLVPVERDEKVQWMRQRHTAADVLQQLERAFGAWPKCSGGTLFVETEHRDADGLPSERSVRWLRREQELFGWLQERADLRWCSSQGLGITPEGEPCSLLGRAELYSILAQRTGDAVTVDGIELLPHVPPVPGVHYVRAAGRRRGGDGSRLSELLDLLNPATELDRQLLRAMLVTPAWGGPPGARPAFVLTSAHGRGSGKTTTAKLVGQLYGGLITITEGEHPDAVRRKLVAPEAAGTRVVLLDNVRQAVRDGSLEDLITAETVQGHRLYAGPARVPNRLTYLITANTPHLSQDLAQRAVPIRLGEPRPGGDFEARVAELMADRRAILEDVTAMLEAPARSRLADADRDRWGLWQRAVLERLPHAEQLVARIRAVRGEVDQDAQDAQAVADVLDQLVEMAAARSVTATAVPARTVALLPTRLVAQALRLAGLRDTEDPRRASNWLRHLADVAPLRGRLTDVGLGARRRMGGRGWQWLGTAADPSDEPLVVDLALSDEAWRSWAEGHSGGDGPARSGEPVAAIGSARTIDGIPF